MNDLSQIALSSMLTCLKGGCCQELISSVIQRCYVCELTVGVDDSIVLGEKVSIAVACVINAMNKIKLKISLKEEEKLILLRHRRHRSTQQRHTRWAAHILLNSCPSKQCQDKKKYINDVLLGLPPRLC